MPTVIFDLYRTLYDPEKEILLPDVAYTLQKLRDAGIRLYVVTRDEGNRSDIISQLGIKDFFHEIVLVPRKSKKVFMSLLSADGDKYIVGDRAREEIFFGNQCGAKTIWFKNGKFASEVPA